MTTELRISTHRVTGYTMSILLGMLMSYAMSSYSAGMITFLWGMVTFNTFFVNREELKQPIGD